MTAIRLRSPTEFLACGSKHRYFFEWYADTKERRDSFARSVWKLSGQHAAAAGLGDIDDFYEERGALDKDNPDAQAERETLWELIRHAENGRHEVASRLESTICPAFAAEYYLEDVSGVTRALEILREIDAKRKP